MSEEPIRSSSNQYTYCGHDPVNMVDRDGLYVETLFDIGCILWDIEELIKHPTWENLGWLLVGIGCAFVPILLAVGGIVRACKMADRAMDAGRAIDRGQDFSKFFKMVDDYPDFTRIEDAYVRESFAGWAFKVEFPRGALLSRYGPEGGRYYTGLVSRDLDQVTDLVAWRRSELAKGGGLFRIPEGKSGWIGVAGPQNLNGQVLKGGAMQIWFPDARGIEKVISWNMVW